MKILLAFFVSITAYSFTEGTGFQNPCSSWALSQGQLYHPYTPDPRRFIQCTAWGKAYVRLCPVGSLWNQEFITCVDTDAQKKSGYKQAQNGQTIQENTKPKTNHNANQPEMGQKTYNGHSKSIHQNGMTQSNGKDSAMGMAGQNGYNGMSTTNGMSPNAGNGYGMQSSNGANNQQGSGEQNGKENYGFTMDRTDEEETADLSSCNDPNTQYVAHPSHPQWYFDCINSYMVARSCPENRFWDSLQNACLTPEEKANANNNDLEQETLQNPCVGSLQRFHPYPGDEHKFVECQTWYSLQIWDCGESAVWVQQYLVCELTHKVNGNGQGSQNGDSSDKTTENEHDKTTESYKTPTPSSPSGSTLDKEMCKNSTSFYHAHPDDVTKYLQCDDFGKIYIRKCGPNKKWNDAYKTCTSEQEAAGNVTDAPNGSGNNMGDSVADVEIDMTSGDTVSISISPPVFVSDMSDNCQPGYYYERVHGQCYKPTPMPHHRYKRSYAQKDTHCPPGFKWSPRYGVCEETEPMQLPSDMKQDCDPGYQWDMSLNMCVQTVNMQQIRNMMAMMMKNQQNTAPAQMTLPKHQAPQGMRDADQMEMMYRSQMGMPQMEHPMGMMMRQFEHEQGMEMSSQEKPQMIDRGGLTPYGYIENYDDLEDSTYNMDEDEGEDDKVEVYDGPNPCLTSHGFFFTYPEDPHYFLQCDEWRKVYLQECPEGLFWSDSILTCLDFIEDNNEQQGKKDETAENKGQQMKNSWVMKGQTNEQNNGQQMNGQQMGSQDNPWSMKAQNKQNGQQMNGQQMGSQNNPWSMKGQKQNNGLQMNGQQIGSQNNPRSMKGQKQNKGQQMNGQQMGNQNNPWPMKAQNGQPMNGQQMGSQNNSWSMNGQKQINGQQMDGQQMGNQNIPWPMKAQNKQNNGQQINGQPMSTQNTNRQNKQNGQQMNGQQMSMGMKKQMYAQINNQQMNGQMNKQMYEQKMNGQSKMYRQQMNGQTDKETNEQMNGQQKNGQINKQMYQQQMNAQQMNGQMNKQMNTEQTNAQQMNGQMYEQQMNQQMNGQQINGRMYQQHMYEQQMNQQMNEKQMNRQMYMQSMNGQQINRQMNGQMYGQTNGQQINGQQQNKHQLNGQQMNRQMYGANMMTAETEDRTIASQQMAAHNRMQISQNGFYMMPPDQSNNQMGAYNIQNMKNRMEAMNNQDQSTNNHAGIVQPPATKPGENSQKGIYMNGQGAYSNTMNSNLMSQQQMMAPNNYHENTMMMQTQNSNNMKQSNSMENSQMSGYGNRQKVPQNMEENIPQASDQMNVYDLKSMVENMMGQGQNSYNMDSVDTVNTDGMMVGVKSERMGRHNRGNMGNYDNFNSMTGSMQGQQSMNTQNSNMNGKSQYVKSMPAGRMNREETAFNSINENNKNIQMPPNQGNRMSASSLLNPCKTSQNTYHPHPTDPHKFVVCSNNEPYVMLCAKGAWWNREKERCESVYGVDLSKAYQ